MGHAGVWLQLLKAKAQGFYLTWGCWERSSVKLLYHQRHFPWSWTSCRAALPLPGLTSLTSLPSLTLWLQLSPVPSLQTLWVITGLTLGPVLALVFCSSSWTFLIATHLPQLATLTGAALLLLWEHCPPYLPCSHLQILLCLPQRLLTARGQG